ncbi:phospholipase/carboxylesterase [Azorhizobium oxalatiphilum]|uniref:Phospholipase/carboxylesterase n=1 Tax=Azorhizobium oxalatiphilum TaxID=980631 RepID=A0A917FII5_9HYPH|nr:dienelactone hydrolase family protein [Azorhizobium oxalatiphilum]GGF80846.1 phospholipase/carboxylesterase [Azorhizobium oxalatiphilum]
MIRALLSAASLSLALALAPLPASAQAAAQPAACPQSAAATRAAPLAYELRQPRTPGDRPPMLVLLHGYAADEKDMIGIADAVPGRFLVVSLRAPLTTPDGGYRWYVNRQTADGFTADDAQLLASRKAVLTTIETIVKACKTSPQEVIVAGFSQGGVMAYELVMMEPQRFIGGASFGGALLDTQQKRIVPSKRLTQTPFFIGHGEADRIVAFSYAEKAKAVLDSHRVILTFHAYPGMGHTVSDQELKDFAGWLTRTASLDK